MLISGSRFFKIATLYFSASDTCKPREKWWDSVAIVRAPCCYNMNDGGDVGTSSIAMICTSIEGGHTVTVTHTRTRFPDHVMIMAMMVSNVDGGR